MRVLAISAIVTASACGSFSSGDSEIDAGAGLPEAGTSADGAANVDASPPIDATPPIDGNVPSSALKVFVTGVGYADILTAANADTKCTSEAAGRLPGTFVAWYPGGNGVSAPARLVNSKAQPVDGPWFRVDGKKVATNRAALTNTENAPLESAISLTAAGETRGGGVWTGTLPDGGVGATCPMIAPTTGDADQTGPAWTQQTFFTATCGSSLALYCFQVE